MNRQRPEAPNAIALEYDLDEPQQKVWRAISIPPFLESTVTFRIASNDRGGTSLRIIHDLPAMKSGRMTKAAANHNGSPIKLAA